jgi:hypothetical protein
MRWRNKTINALIALASVGGATLFSVWQTATMDPPPIPPTAMWLLGGAITLVATAGAAWAVPPDPLPLIEQLRADPKWRAEQRARLHDEVNDLLSFTVDRIAVRPEQTGAVVYFPDVDGVLQPTFAYNKRQALRELTVFEKWQGCTGIAWGHREQWVADLTAAKPDELRRSWHMRPDQIEATKDLKVVVSTPVWSADNPEHAHGVLSFDSLLPATESGLTTEESLEAATKCANLLSRILARSPLSLADLREPAMIEPGSRRP